MPDRRRHRGPHPDDPTLFAAARVPELRRAVAELSWLLSRGYSDRAATKLVGDRYRLTARQRVAVRRCACTDAQRDRRAASAVAANALAGASIVVDGFNVLTTIEAALASGVLLCGRDRCLRDMASMHGSWRRVAETTTAASLLVDVLAAAAPATVAIVLDRPVANSGRLAAILRAAATGRLRRCTVELADAADRTLLAHDAIVATADSAVLDRARGWTDLVRPVITGLPAALWLVDLGGG